MRQDSLEDHDPLNCFGLRRLFQWRSRVKLRRSPGFIVCGSSLPRRARALSKLPRVFQEQGGRNGPRNGFSGGCYLESPIANLGEST